MNVDLTSIEAYCFIVSIAYLKLRL